MVAKPRRRIRARRVAAQEPSEASALPCTLRVKARLPELSAAERRVAKFVLADERRILELSLAQAARQAGTSEASLLRFCRQLGYRGYPGFKIALAQELAVRSDAARQSAADVRLKQSDDLPDVPARVLTSTIRSLEQTLSNLNLGEYQRAVHALLRARRVDIYGVSTSAGIGVDAANKLMRLGVPCQVFSDAHVQLMAAAALGKGDVAIGFSHSGQTRETVEALAAARASGATTIAVVNFEGSRLAQHADITLRTASFETVFPRDTMVSRISQLAIIDALYAGVVLEGYARFKGRLARVDGLLAGKLLPRRDTARVGGR
jgi:RpiR family carbohydrate utilization transcriptional regulator